MDDARSLRADVEVATVSAIMRRDTFVPVALAIAIALGGAAVLMLAAAPI